MVQKIAIEGALQYENDILQRIANIRRAGVKVRLTSQCPTYELCVTLSRQLQKMGTYHKLRFFRIYSFPTTGDRIAFERAIQDYGMVAMKRIEG